MTCSYRLTLLLGLAYRNRHDVSRMLLLVQSVQGLRHPEVIALLASEFTRVPSSPSSRTYLTAVLESLESAQTRESWHALLAKNVKVIVPSGGPKSAGAPS